MEIIIEVRSYLYLRKTVKYSITEILGQVSFKDTHVDKSFG